MTLQSMNLRRKFGGEGWSRDIEISSSTRPICWGPGPVKIENITSGHKSLNGFLDQQL